jgi:signal transduction histidine kinase
MTWYRSLYWKIAIGFMLALAAMLVVQAVLFLWVASRGGPTVPGLPPERFAEAVAAEIGDAFEREPALDLQQFVREQYGGSAHPVLVLMTDGRMAANGSFPDQFVQQSRAMLARPPLPPFERFGRGRRFGRGADRDAFDPVVPPRPDAARPPGPAGRGFLPRGPGPRPMRPAFVEVEGQVSGLVVVPARAPFSFLLARYGPTLALVTGGVLVAGALLAAVVIFGPARRRLRGVENAARRLGAGDLSARAPVRGGDEVAAVASAFNAMADDLSARAEALTASDAARRQLLADVSHELNTPVTAMRGYLETLRMPEMQLDEATRARYLDIVADETGRLERIIKDLLDLARVEGGGGALAIEAVSLGQLFERVAARHERACRERDLTLTAAVAPGAETVRGDRDRLEQALQNLAANALRYAPAGTVIELEARPFREAEAFGLEKTGVAISVTDHGPGIPPEHLPHVFDRFYKAASSRSHDGNGGSGLGLSIVKAIVERHGGTISVASQTGRTTFELRMKK